MDSILASHVNDATNSAAQSRFSPNFTQRVVDTMSTSPRVTVRDLAAWSATLHDFARVTNDRLTFTSWYFV